MNARQNMTAGLLADEWHQRFNVPFYVDQFFAQTSSPLRFLRVLGVLGG
jgi:hypothetical protein